MKIAILGYGKMGKIISELAEAKGHEIILKIGVDNLDELTPANLAKADVAIEFSRPEAAVQNIKTCIKVGVPVVSGTTGWLDKMADIKQYADEKEGAFFYASNFSIGVNIFFQLNQYLAKMMNGQFSYEVDMEEIHHTEKLDAPSGTAITLAKDIIAQLDRKNKWLNNLTDAPDELAIISKRLPKVPGTHSIHYHSPIDTIEIKHTAHSREGFAKGAIQAAEWLIGKKGCYGMKDMLGF